MRSGGAGLPIEEVADEGGLDELQLAACGVAQGEGREAIELAVCAGARVVQEREGIAREELAVAAGEREPVADVVGGVVEGDGVETKAGVEAREQRLVRAERETVLELGQADEDERQQGARVHS